MKLFTVLLGLVLLTLGQAHARENLTRYADMEWRNATSAGATGGFKPSGGAGPTSYRPTASGPAAFGSGKLPWPGKNEAQSMAKWRAMATPRDIAKTLMSPGSAAVTLLGGWAMKELIDAACVRVFNGTLVDGAVWDKCIFMDHTGTQYRYASGGNFAGWVGDEGWRWTPEEAAEAWRAYAASQRPTANWSDCKVTITYTVDWPSGPYPASPRLVQVGAPCTNSIGVSGGGFTSYNTMTGATRTFTEQVPNGYGPATPQEVEDKLANTEQTWCQSDFTAGLSDGKCNQVLENMLTQGLTVPTDVVLYSPSGSPDTVSTQTYPDGTVITTTTKPDGSKVVTATYTTHEVGYSPPSQDVTHKTTTTQTNTTYAPDGSQVGAAETTTTESSDESTAVTSPTELNPKTKAEETLKPLTDFVKDPTAALPKLPVINWTFRLPSGCAPIAIPAFAPYLQQIDICPYVNLFHDIMGVIWIIGGMFGAISLFFRNALAQT